jgi:hypothetical protein
VITTVPPVTGMSVTVFAPAAQAAVHCAHFVSAPALCLAVQGQGKIHRAAVCIAHWETIL